MKKQIKTVDFKKHKTLLIGFRGWFLQNDVYLSSKVFLRKNLSKMRKIKEISPKDINFLLKQISDAEIRQHIASEISDSVLVQDSSNEYLIIPKVCYWW